MSTLPKRQKEKEVKPSDTWACETCAEGKTAIDHMTFEQMKQHLVEVHGIDPKGKKCMRQMRSHMDGPTWFATTDQLTFEDPHVVLIHSVVMPRDKDDMMRYA